MSETIFGQNVQISITTPAGKQVLGPDLELTACSYSTKRQGLFDGMSCQFVPVPGDWWRPFSHVEVKVDGDPVWEGRGGNPKIAGRWLYGFDGRGHGAAGGILWDEPFVSADATLMTSGELLREIITDSAPLVRIGSYDAISDPAGEHAPVEFNDRYPGEILDQLVTEGTIDGYPIAWYIENNRKLILETDVPPSVGTYRVSLDDTTLDRQSRDDELWTRVRVRYTPSGGVESYTGWSAASKDVTQYGVARRKTIDGGELTDAAALQIRDAQAAYYGRRRFATSIRRDSGQSLASPIGSQLTPYHRVQANGWIEIEESGEMLPILSTSVDLFGATLTVQCGEERRDYLTALRDREREARRNRAGLNATTSARRT